MPAKRSCPAVHSQACAAGRFGLFIVQHPEVKTRHPLISRFRKWQLSHHRHEDLLGRPSRIFRDASSVDAEVSIAVGNHWIVVQAWDNHQNVYKAPGFWIDVTSGGGGGSGPIYSMIQA